MNTFTIFLILITFVCFLLIVVIMVQNPKGGGLDPSLGGSTIVGGVKNTNDFLDKSTWTLAGLLIILILMSSMSFNDGPNGDSKILDPNAAISIPSSIETDTTDSIEDTTQQTQEAE